MSRNLTLLFDSNPPEDPEARRKLFYNREAELKWALTELRSNPAVTKVLAIHGDTRTGKSHFAQHMLAQATEQLGGLGVIINANQRETAQNLLEDLFGELAIQLDEVEWDRDNPVLAQIHADFKEFTELLKPLVFGEVEQTELTQGRKLLGRASAHITLKPRYAESGFLVEASEEHQTGEKQVLRAPKGPQLAEMVRWIAEAIAELQRGPVLILVDDQDLLTTGDDVEETAELLMALKILAASDRTVVITTVRTAYWNGREKDLKDFVEIRALGDKELKAIYEGRLDAYNDGEEVFASTALRWLLDGADGRVGMFLQRCHQLHRAFFGSGKRIGKREIRKFIDGELDALWQHPAEQQVLATVFEHVRRGEGELKLENGELTLARRSKLWLRVLKPLQSRPGWCSIDPLYLKAIRERIEDGA